MCSNGIQALQLPGGWSLVLWYHSLISTGCSYMVLRNTGSSFRRKKTKVIFNFCFVMKPVSQQIKKSPPFMEPKVHYCHWSLSRARWIHSTPSHPVYLRPILILSSLLHTSSKVSLFFGFSTKFLYPHFSSLHAWYMFCTLHTPWFYHPSNIWWRYKLCSSSLCKFLQLPVTSSLLGPNERN
jgi:hypothetical protein